MLGGERGTAGREGLAHPGAREGDPVEVALADDRAARSPDRLERVGEAVEGLALLEDRGLRRVQVFGFLIRLDGASAEADDAAAHVLDREGDPAAQPVVDAAPALARRDEAGLHGVVRLHASIAESLRNGIPFGGGETDAVGLGRGRVEAPAREVVARGRRALPRERLTVEVLGELVRFEQSGREAPDRLDRAPRGPRWPSSPAS